MACCFSFLFRSKPESNRHLQVHSLLPVLGVLTSKLELIAENEAICMSFMQFGDVGQTEFFLHVCHNRFLTFSLYLHPIFIEFYILFHSNIKDINKNQFIQCTRTDEGDEINLASKTAFPANGAMANAVLHCLY